MRTVTQTYEFKLYDSKKNKYLDEQIEIASEIWNFCVAMCRMYYKVYTLKQRSWDCRRCGNHLDRDVNAAINIKRLGLAKLGYSAV